MCFETHESSFESENQTKGEKRNGKFMVADGG